MKCTKLYILLISLFSTVFSYAQEPIAEVNDLTNKRIGVIGDSYVRNHTDAIENTWHYKFAKRYNMQYFNFGRNGNCIAYDRDRFGEAIYKRYMSMPDSLDYVLVIGGHNDTYMLDSIGGIDEFKEKMTILCDGLVNKYPSAKIFFFTRWSCENFQGSDAEQIVDAMIEVCGNYSIPIFDCARKGNIFAYNESFREIFFLTKTDSAHLNAKGHDRFLKCAEHFILQY